MIRGRWWVLVGLGLSGLLLLGTASAQADTEPHDPILVEGDADLCDDEDGDGVLDALDDGIVNCATADGSSQRPYVIEGWSISVGATCDSGTDPVTSSFCNPPRACSASRVRAGLLLCNITRFIVVRDLEIRNSYPTTIEPEYEPGLEAELKAGEAYSSAIAAISARSLDIENVSIETTGIGVYAASTNYSLPNEVVMRNVDVRTRLEGARPSEVSARGLVGVPLILVRGVEATLINVTADADGRDRGIEVKPSEADVEGPLKPFGLFGSRIIGAHAAGLQVTYYKGTIRNNSFVGNGVPGITQAGTMQATGTQQVQSMGGALLIENGDFEVLDNDFSVVGFGVHVGRSGSAVIEGNRFHADATEVEAQPRQGHRDVAMVIDVESRCPSRAAHNEIEDLRVFNNNFNCLVRAELNWWGNASGPWIGPSHQDPPQTGLLINQINGPIAFVPFLNRTLKDLPFVDVLTPRTGDEVYGLVRVTGRAGTSSDGSLDRVQVSADRYFSDRSEQVAEGTLQWSVRVPLFSTEPTPVTLWIRACEGQAMCGLAYRLDVVAIPEPNPPIALVRAGPSIAEVGETVVLDASLSYSPQGLDLEGYRFTFGDDRATEWSTEPTTSVTYSEAGSYLVRVEVRDSRGLTSVNPAQATVRILGDPGQALDEPSGLRAISSPSTMSLLFTLVLVVAGWQARRGAA